MQTNFLVFSRRKLDFGKVLCFDAHILALHLTSFVGYLSDGILDTKEFPVMGRVSVFGMRCFDAMCVFLKSSTKFGAFPMERICLKLSLFCKKAFKAMQMSNLGFLYRREGRS